MAIPTDPTKPCVPISYPITDLETLLSRSYFDSFHYAFNVSSVPLPAATVEKPPRRRILVCHDFKGGYTDDDKWVQGGTNAGAYAIWHWYLMDVFVYFSHHLVTLPPPGWINSAHTHGIKVLGTFLTEWEKGREICNSLLSTTESARTYAERLTELADILGFDGWLINMEVSLDPHQIPNLKEFIFHLTQTMHNVIHGSLVIWYDSVTGDGELKYQNQLNEKNKPFFDICDGIFCNYCWKEDYPQDSGTVAGDRRFDVYMGIDVWGRGTYGGGQWNTNAALDVLKKHNVSAAIFGPGWVYETQQGENFQTAQNQWWSLVEQSCEVLQRYPNVLPFYSNFDQGHGFHYSIGGFKAAESPWNNLSCQGFQPALDFMDTSKGSIEVLFNFEDAPYTGGGSISCKGKLNLLEVFSTRLFLGQLMLNQPLSLSYYIKSDGNSQIALSLSFSSGSITTTKVILLPESSFPVGPLALRHDTIIPAHSIPDPSSSPDWVRHESIIPASDQTLTEIQLLCYLNSTEVVPRSLSHTLSTAMVTDVFPYSASLGLIRIEIPGQNIEFPSSTSWITTGEYIAWSSNEKGHKTVSLKLTWTLKSGLSPLFVAYNIYVKKVSDGVEKLNFLGVVKAKMYYVSALKVGSDVSSLSFVIQVCAVNGVWQGIDESPRHLLAVEELSY